MAKIFRKTHNPYALCAITHSLTLKVTWGLTRKSEICVEKAKKSDSTSMIL